MAVIKCIKGSLDCIIEKIRYAEAILNDHKNFENDIKFDDCLKVFNVMKAKVETSKNLDNEFYDRVKARVQKYLKQLQEIGQTMDDISKRFDSLIEETKKASWN